MKRFTFLGLSLLAACATYNQDTKTGREAALTFKDPTTIFIENGQVGPYEVNGPIPVLGTYENVAVSLVTETVSEEGETYQIPHHVLSVDGQEKVRFQLRYDQDSAKYVPSIGEIIVKSDGIKTKKGIGVGSSLTDFIKAYPDYKIWYTYVAQRVVLETSELEMQFILNASDYKGDLSNTSDFTPLKSTGFSPDTKINYVRIYVPKAVPVDPASLSAIDKTIVDSAQYFDQSVQYASRNVTFFNDESGRLRKVKATKEGESGDVAESAELYFDLSGNTIYASIVYDVIPENFYGKVDVAANNGLRKILKSVQIKNGKEIVMDESAADEILNNGFYVNTAKEIEAQKGNTLVKRSDFISSKEDVFEAEGGMISGSDRFVDYKTYKSGTKYRYDKYEVSQFEDGETNGNKIYYRTKNQKDSTTISDPNGYFFIGMWKEFIILDAGTGVIRTLSIYDIGKKKVVYSTPYVLINILGDQLVITRLIEDASSRTWLPACEEEKAVGQGVDYAAVVKVNLNTLEENITGQIFCSVAQ